MEKHKGKNAFQENKEAEKKTKLGLKAKLKAILDSNPIGKVKAVKRHFGDFYNIRRRMCRKCVALTNKNSMRPMSDYCARCQNLARRVFER